MTGRWQISVSSRMAGAQAKQDTERVAPIAPLPDIEGCSIRTQGMVAATARHFRIFDAESSLNLTALLAAQCADAAIMNVSSRAACDLG